MVSESYRRIGLLRLGLPANPLRQAIVPILLACLGCGVSIHDAVRSGDIESVRALLAADPTLIHAATAPLQKQPIHDAVGSGSPAMVEFVLDAGANINARDKTGLTPLHVAAIMDQPKIAQLLIDKGGELEARDTFGDTPLHLAAIFQKVSMIEALAGRGANLTARNNEKRTPLQSALAERKPDSVNALKRLGATE